MAWSGWRPTSRRYGMFALGTHVQSAYVAQALGHGFKRPVYLPFAIKPDVALHLRDSSGSV